MATIERMNIKYPGGNGKDAWISANRCFNVSKPVGPGQENERSDVLVVQALFDFLASKDNPNHGWLSILKIKAANVSGVFDGATATMIRRFQSGGDYRNLGTMVVDGVVHPASLDGRVLRFDGAQMTIVKLNQEASWGSKSQYNHDLVSTMLAKYPFLRTAVTDMTGGKEGSIKLPA